MVFLYPLRLLHLLASSKEDKAGKWKEDEAQAG